MDTSPDRLDTAKTLAVAWSLAAFVLLIALVGRHETNLPIGYFTRDPAAVLEGRVYVGLVSVVGLFLWWTAATAMGFGSWHASRLGARDRAWAFGVAAVSIAYLAVDDAFQLHEVVYLSLGLSDHVVQPVYVIGTLLLIIVGRRFLASTNWRLLVIAGMWFAISIAADLITDAMRYVGFEDGAKLFGVATLAAYCLHTAGRELAPSIVPPERAVRADDAHTPPEGGHGVLGMQQRACRL